MTLRRFAALKKSKGTVIPQKVRSEVMARDGVCIGPRVGMSDACQGAIELDHVRASHGIGMKSATDVDNLVALCGLHHREKTEHGRIWRPRLIAYLVNDGVQPSDPYTVELAQRTAK